MKPQTATSTAKQSRRKPSKRSDLPKPAKLRDYPDLQDLFINTTERKTRLHLLREHREKMQALEQLHQAQLQSIREQLQISLFKIWNEMWLQKKATYAKAHKEWLKVLAA
jgi:hypothetical protein